jgi:hypothetical protein
MKAKGCDVIYHFYFHRPVTNALNGWQTSKQRLEMGARLSELPGNTHIRWFS